MVTLKNVELNKLLNTLRQRRMSLEAFQKGIIPSSRWCYLYHSATNITIMSAYVCKVF